MSGRVGSWQLWALATTLTPSQGPESRAAQHPCSPRLSAFQDESPPPLLPASLTFPFFVPPLLLPGASPV